MLMVKYLRETGLLPLTYFSFPNMPNTCFFDYVSEFKWVKKNYLPFLGYRTKFPSVLVFSARSLLFLLKKS
jgi:hypothetical protein